MTLRPALSSCAVVVLSVVLGGCVSDTTTGTSQPSPPGGTHHRVDGGSAPTTPPARVCGSAGLRGPATRPTGAIPVSPSQSLERAVSSAPRGATFWLTTGVHELG